MNLPILRRHFDALATATWGYDLRRQAIVRGMVVIGVLVAAAWLGRAPTRSLVALMFVGVGGFVILNNRSVAIPGLLLAIAFIPVQIGTSTESSINIAMLGVAALGGIWAIDLFLDRSDPEAHTVSMWPWIALIAAGILSVFAGAAQWNPLVIVKDNFFLVQMTQLSIYVLSALAFLLTSHFTSRRKGLRIIAALVICFGLLTTFGVYVPGVRVASYRLLLHGVNLRVCFTAFAMAIALFDHTLVRRWRVLLGLAAVFGVLLPMLNGGGWVAGWLPSLVAIVTLVMLRLGSKSYRVAIAVSPFVPLIAIVIMRWQISVESWSFNTRMVAWRGLFDLVGDRWLFGLGLASYGHYWRGVLGIFSYLDPETGYLHFTNAPQVNMHNNYLDVFGQMGVIGVLALAWLLIALLLNAWRVFHAEPAGFGKAYAAAAVGILVAMSAASVLGDWLFPFVYNIGLDGFRDSSVTWLVLGGLLVLKSTSGTDRQAAARELSPPEELAEGANT